MKSLLLLTIVILNKSPEQSTRTGSGLVFNKIYYVCDIFGR